MHDIILLHTLDHPDLRPYLTLRQPEEHRRQGIFVSEGDKVTLRLFAAGFDVCSVLLTGEWYERIASVELASLPRGIPVFIAPLPLLRSIVGFHLHQGLMAVARIPEEPPIEGLPRPHLLVTMDGLNQSENIGVVMRNAVALGADGVIAGGGAGSPWLRRSVRNSMGAVFRTRVYHPADLTGFLTTLRSTLGTRLLALDAHGSTPLAGADLTGNICLIAGNEHDGVSSGVLDICDGRVVIPMRNGVDSLNVAGAVGVALYEAASQRQSPLRLSDRS